MVPALKHMHDSKDFSEDLDGLISGSLYLGAAFGTLGGSVLAERHGRRTATVIGEVLIMFGSALQVLAIDPGLLTVLRSILGIGIGICLVAKPIYIAELSPPD